MKYSKKIFEHLEPIAINSNEGWARLAAAVVYKNSIVAIGVNSKKSHPFQAKWGRNPESIFLHAEIDAIKNSLRHLTVDEITNADLYVLRMKKDGPGGSYQHGLAKPCAAPGCQSCIANFGIRNVFYTTNENWNIGYL